MLLWRRLQSSERARVDDKVQTLQEATTRQIQAERARATAIADEIQTAVTAQIVEAQQSETEMADSLERALEENEQLRAQLDQLRVEHEQTSGWLRTETAKTTAQETSLRNIQVDRDQLKADLEASRGRVRELTDDRTDLSKRLACGSASKFEPRVGAAQTVDFSRKKSSQDGPPSAPIEGHLTKRICKINQRGRYCTAMA